MKILTLFTILFCLVSLSIATDKFGAVPGNCSGTWNTLENINFDPVLNQKVPNGQKYVIQYDGRPLTVLNLSGNAYQMGYAYGSLMKEETAWLLENFFAYLPGYISDNVNLLNNLPAFLKKLVAKGEIGAIKLALDLTYEVTSVYTPQRFKDEMQGIADGAGVPVSGIRQVNMFPELIKAACSILGVWGPASITREVLHLRALDWNVDCPIAQYPTVIVYHSTEDGSVPFANIAWAGFVGSITGVSQYTGVGEKQGNLTSDKNTTRFGKPWNFELRDVLQFAKTIDQAVDSMENTKRTCSIYIGVGSKINNTFRIIEEDAVKFDSYSDQDWHFDAGSPQMNGIIYKAMHSTYCFRNMLLPNYGNISPETIKQLTSVDETGDAQMAIMDYKNNHIYIAYPQWKEKIAAYSRPTVFINLNPFFTGTQEPLEVKV